MAGAVPCVRLWVATEINKESRSAKGEGDCEEGETAPDESGNSLPQLSAVFNANFATDWQSSPGSITKLFLVSPVLDGVCGMKSPVSGLST